MRMPETHALREELRKSVEAPEILIVPGVVNTLHAKLAEGAGFRAVFTTGAGIANSLLGVPDLGMLALPEVVALNRYIVGGVSVPVIADADTGYGGPLSVVRTVHELEDAGVAALTLEDQIHAKRCGHFDRKEVVAREVMIERLAAALEGRRDPNFLLIARTDAYATHGPREALERARLYAHAGADVVFVEAPATTDDLQSIPRAVDRPCLVNIVEGGRTPALTAAELEAMGYAVVLFANFALRMGAAAVQRGFARLRETGTTESLATEMLSWDERQAIVGLPQWEQLEARIAARALESVTIADALASSDGPEPQGSLVAGS